MRAWLSDFLVFLVILYYVWLAILETDRQILCSTYPILAAIQYLRTDDSSDICIQIR